METIRKYEAPSDFTHTAVSSKMIATAEHVINTETSKVTLIETGLNQP